jgi:dCTP deaminase
MAFWSKERLESEQGSHPLVTPFVATNIEQNAYALGIAAEYAIGAGEHGGQKRIAPDGENITIAPGQFALLVTQEEVWIPSNAMGFISMKARIKLRGLINVSGFHVDPGFRGTLKFAVYNSGGIAIDLTPGQRVFLIWYCDLDQPTKAIYSSGEHQGQKGITEDDVMKVRGITASPSAIKASIERLEDKTNAEIRRLEMKITDHQAWTTKFTTGIGVAVFSAILGAIVALLMKNIGEREREAPVSVLPTLPASASPASASPAPASSASAGDAMICQP